MSLRPGVRLGAYEIVSAIGAGGMGEVYRARDMKLGRDVALKIVSTDFTHDDIWISELTGDRKASAYVQTPNFETQGTLSPDDRWLAYTSDLSGRFEIYVQSFPEPGSRMQVSANGGSSARWRPDGKELFYLAPDGTLMAVPVRSLAPLEFGPPAPLFQFLSPRATPAQVPPYDVTADGQRFIVNAVMRREDPSIEVLLNWPALVAAAKP